MVWWECLLWGLFGAFLAEGLQFNRAVRRTKKWPWRHRSEPGAGPYFGGLLVRFGMSAGLALAASEGGQVSGAIGAIIIGIAIPQIIDQLGQASIVLHAAAPDTAATAPERGEGNADAA